MTCKNKYSYQAWLLCGFILLAGVVVPLFATNLTWTVQLSGKQEQEKKQEENEKAAREMYKQAARNYEQNHFWQAAVDLILILDFYPNYSKLEDTVFLLATCLYDMEMYDGADRMYRYLLRSVTKTRLVAESILGLQKVSYQNGDFQQSLKFYKALESHYTEHEAIYESRYYAGQTYFHTQNYNLVHNLMPHIDKKSDFYPFALYTSGLAYLKKKMSGRLSLILNGLQSSQQAIHNAKKLLQRRV